MLGCLLNGTGHSDSAGRLPCWDEARAANVSTRGLIAYDAAALVSVYTRALVREKVSLLRFQFTPSA